MKNKFFTLIALFVCFNAFSQTKVVLENASFEEPATGKIQNGYDDVPGWENTPESGDYNDSGVDESGDGNHVDETADGTWYGYLDWRDGAVRQTSEQEVSAGDSVKVSLQIHNVWDAGKLLVVLYADNGTSVDTISQTEFVSPEYKSPADTVFEVEVPDGVTGDLGIELKGLEKGWIGFDNIELWVTENTTHIENEEISFDYNIYPNPVTDIINIKVDANDYTLVTINNVIGEIVYQKRFKKFIQINQNEIGKPGLYIINIATRGNTVSQKVIIK